MSPTLYEANGTLRVSAFGDDAMQLLGECLAWLEEIERGVFLPIDLIVTLVERGHEDLRVAIARAARGTDAFDDVGEQLRLLARRVEPQQELEPALHLDNFSLGFMGILDDAHGWAREAGRDTVTESDIARVVRWRAELQESASVRWAIRQLAQPGSDRIFDDDGALRPSNFTAHIWQVFFKAVKLSCSAGMPFLGTPHLVAALACSRQSILRVACEQSMMPPRKIRRELMRIVGVRSPAQPEFSLGRRTLTPRLVRMIAAAAEEAEKQGRQTVSERELLEAFLADGGSSLGLLTSFDITPRVRDLLDNPKSDREREAIGEATGEDPAFPLGYDDEDGTIPFDYDGEESPHPTLDQVGVDLTREAREGRLPTVVGRDNELRRIINVLLRTEQRNPLLTGDAGVGKTALAAALAQRIASGAVPEPLKDMKVVEINGASLIGGTSYRGDLEARIESLLAEAEDRVILFMDEAHVVFSPRSGSGRPAEVPNHFKSALSKGKIAVVAATTETEYQRWIAQDPALKRRFERIEIPELSREVTRDILSHLATDYEQRYSVPISPAAVDAAIELSSRFIPEQSQPDKAKKLLMDAAIDVSSQRALERAQSRSAGETDGTNGGTPNTRVVTRTDVARLVAEKTGAPLDRVLGGSASWWHGLGERLQERVIGQPVAMTQIARRLINGRLSGLGKGRPQGVFVLVGPAGVGKSETAEALAAEIFGNAEAVLRLEMSDFAGEHAAARLIGPPPGYVGYTKDDSFVTPLRRRPSTVVLLRNFQLAHPSVQERFARLLIEGELVNTKGLKADVSHAVFVITVDHDANARAAIGFGGTRGERTAEDALKSSDPMLVERLRGVAYDTVALRGVADDDYALCRAMVAHRIEAFSRSFAKEYGVEITVSDAVRAALLRDATTIHDTRELEAFFRAHIVEPAGDALLAGFDGDTLRIGADTASAPAPKRRAKARRQTTKP